MTLKKAIHNPIIFLECTKPPTRTTRKESFYRWKQIFWWARATCLLSAVSAVSALMLMCGRSRAWRIVRRRRRQSIGRFEGQIRRFAIKSVNFPQHKLHFFLSVLLFVLDDPPPKSSNSRVMVTVAIGSSIEVRSSSSGNFDQKMSFLAHSLESLPLRTEGNELSNQKIRRRVFALCVLNVLQAFGIGMLMPALPILTTEVRSMIWANRHFFL